jgi:AraC-like DNA-binding protein
MEYFKGKSLTVPPKAAEVLKRLIDECNATYRVSEHPIALRDSAPFGGEQMTELLLEEFLLLLIREFENYVSVVKMSLNQEKITPQIEEICSYLKANVYGRLTLEDLTVKFHFSKSFLCEQFKKGTGLSPITYYLDLKLTEAKRLLREDDLTITEVAEKLGFESPEYFSRYFKKRVGRSPREFRKMLINDASLHKKQ